jgi:predicted unusual protein kinase regulating ubiquinone biosynthesis (AarF/ABC1/UbiB family)
VSLSVRVTVIATWEESDASTWNISFRMAAAFMVFAGIVVLLFVRDSRAAQELASRETEKESFRERVAEILEVPNAKLLLASLFLTVASSGATARLLPLYNREALGAGGAEQSTAVIVGGVFGVLVSLPAGVWLSRKLTRRQSAVAAQATGAVGAALHLVVTDIWQSVAIGVVTGAFAISAVIALAALVLQLLPRSGGMGERLGLAAGPFALIGVLSTYVAAVTVDITGDYRSMWVVPAALGIVNTLLMTRLWVPEWAQHVDVRRFFRERAAAARRARRMGTRPAARGGLFSAEVAVDDVDASVVFEVGRHALGNPYAPPVTIDLDEPAVVRDARRVLGLAGAASATEIADVAALLHNDVMLADADGEHRGQPAVIERLGTPAWEPHPYQSWRLVAVEGRRVELQCMPPPPEGDVHVVVDFTDDGRVASIERRVSETVAQQADAHAARLGYPVPIAVDLSSPNKRVRRRRAVRTFWVIGRHCGHLIVRRALRRPIAPIQIARGLRRVFEGLGGGYVKFGQLVASSPSIFGDDVAEEFRTTLDAGPAVPIDEVRALIERELDRPFREVFASIDPTPLGRASIAVVHKATTVDGHDVAVKVIRPGVEDIFATDLALMEPLFVRLAGPSAARLLGPLLQMLQGFRRQVSEELDLRNEARAMVHYRRLLSAIDLPDIVVPEPFLESSSRRVLTMELLDGVAVDDLTTIEQFGFDPAPLVEQAVKAWFVTGIVYGTFHGDVHAGNLMLLRDGRIGLIDWGIVARLDPSTHMFFRQLIAGSLGDEAAWDDIAAFFTQMLGPMMARVELTPAELTKLIRPRIESVLTQPFGQMSLGALISDNQREAAEAEGEQLSIRERRAAARRRRAEQGTPEPAGSAPPFNRGLFLLGKQLMYFERYGRMYLSDVSILEDREFFRHLVALEPEPIA